MEFWSQQFFLGCQNLSLIHDALRTQFRYAMLSEIKMVQTTEKLWHVGRFPLSLKLNITPIEGNNGRVTVLFSVILTLLHSSRDLL